uniref:Uncharacterized protein n=1 Tax=Compsopogon caeruleus TaxID=31354 RepID=A0A7S1TD17_9RHOD|mmetsp:Transcript_17191/g.35732  ORF Transcript_17191/g.35732 Transcript_17191/m.35732 type:complete len:169 (+) Transcript_17191:360-866(+)
MDPSERIRSLRSEQARQWLLQLDTTNWIVTDQAMGAAVGREVTYFAAGDSDQRIFVPLLFPNNHYILGLVRACQDSSIVDLALPSLTNFRKLDWNLRMLGGSRVLAISPASVLFYLELDTVMLNILDQGFWSIGWTCDGFSRYIILRKALQCSKNILFRLMAMWAIIS